MPTMKFHIIGPHEGSTVELGRFSFVDGVLEFTGSDADLLAVSRTLREQYQAFPEHELEAAKAAFDEAQAEAALTEEETPSEVEGSLKQRLIANRFIAEGLNPLQVLGDGPPARELAAIMEKITGEVPEVPNAAEEARAEARRLAAEEAERLEAERLAAEGEAERAAEAAAEAAALAALAAQGNGGGETPPADAKIETVADALAALDPANDEHWTSRGVPSIEAMTKLLGRQVARAEVEDAAPDFTRAVAKAAKAS